MRRPSRQRISPTSCRRAGVLIAAPAPRLASLCSAKTVVLIGRGILSQNPLEKFHLNPEPRHDAELAKLLLDSTIVSNPLTCSRCKRGQNPPGFGLSLRGFNAKIHVAVNDEGQPIKLHLTEREHYRCDLCRNLVGSPRTRAVITDKGYDSDPLRLKVSLRRR